MNAEQKDNKTPLEKKLIKTVYKKNRTIRKKAYDLCSLQDFTLKLIAKLPNRMEEIQKLLSQHDITIYWATEYAEITDYENAQGKSHKAFIYPSGKYFAPLSKQPDGKLHLVYSKPVYDLLSEGILKIDWNVIQEKDFVGFTFLKILNPPVCQCHTCKELVRKYQ